MARSLSSPAQPAVEQVDTQPGERAVRAARSTTSSAALSRTGALVGVASSSSAGSSVSPCSSSSPVMRGHTTYDLVALARPPRGPAPRRGRPSAGCSARGTTFVCTAARPAGSSVRVEISRSPKTVIATVRGIGVAVITSTWGGVPALSVRAARCSTPNRCCSSTTTRPRSANWTCSCSSAWVPITMPASPLAAWSIASARAALGIEPVSRTTRVASACAAEHAAGREVAEQRGDRAVVLLGEHLGRRQQRGLAAGVDDPQHRPQRDEGLAGADLALEQPVHRVGARRGRPRSRADTSCWPRGQRERQPRVERGQQAAAAGRGPGRRAARARRGAGPARAG